MRAEKIADQEYQDDTLSNVQREGDGYLLSFTGLNGAVLYIEDPGFEPKTGDSVRSYGGGMGYPVRGIDINDREAYYQTDEEYRTEAKKRREEAEAQRKQALEDKGGVSPDPGTGKYDWRESMGEISGFGGTYEAACRAMLIRALDFWDGQGEGFDPKYHSYENVTGVMLDDNEDAKKLDAAMMDAEIVYGNGQREKVGNGASGAMHHAVINHAFFVRANGWEEYVEELKKREPVDDDVEVN